MRPRKSGGPDESGPSRGAPVGRTITNSLSYVRGLSRPHADNSPSSQRRCPLEAQRKRSAPWPATSSASLQRSNSISPNEPCGRSGIISMRGAPNMSSATAQDLIRCLISRTTGERDAGRMATSPCAALAIAVLRTARPSRPLAMLSSLTL